MTMEKLLRTLSEDRQRSLLAKHKRTVRAIHLLAVIYRKPHFDAVELLTATVFLDRNDTKAFEHVTYYLVNVLETSATEAPLPMAAAAAAGGGGGNNNKSPIKTWPIIDKRDSAAYRRDLLQYLNERVDAFRTLNMSSLIATNNVRFVDFIFKFASHVAAVVSRRLVQSDREFRVLPLPGPPPSGGRFNLPLMRRVEQIERRGVVDVLRAMDETASGLNALRAKTAAVVRECDVLERKLAVFDGEAGGTAAPSVDEIEATYERIDEKFKRLRSLTLAKPLTIDADVKRLYDETTRTMGERCDAFVRCAAGATHKVDVGALETDVETAAKSIATEAKRINDAVVDVAKRLERL